MRGDFGDYDIDAGAMQTWYLVTGLTERVGEEYLASAVWEHELGHIILGYPDNYYSGQNIFYYMLSAYGYSANNYGSHGRFRKELSALEAYLYPRWLHISPWAKITQGGLYTVRATESGQPWDAHDLRILPLNDDATHFLGVEHRWIHNNPQSQYSGGDPLYDPRQNGLQIYEVDLLEDHGIWRFEPASNLHGSFGPGEVFESCISGRHIRIEAVPTAEREWNAFWVELDDC